MGKEESSFFNLGEPLLAPMGDEYCLSLVISVRGELERVRSKPGKLVMLLLVPFRQFL